MAILKEIIRGVTKNADEISAGIAKGTVRGAGEIAPETAASVRGLLDNGLLAADDTARATVNTVEEVAPTITKAADNIVAETVENTTGTIVRAVDEVPAAATKVTDHIAAETVDTATATIVRTVDEATPVAPQAAEIVAETFIRTADDIAPTLPPTLTKAADEVVARGTSTAFADNALSIGAKNADEALDVAAKAAPRSGQDLGVRLRQNFYNWTAENISNPVLRSAVEIPGGIIARHPLTSTALLSATMIGGAHKLTDGESTAAATRLLRHGWDKTSQYVPAVTNMVASVATSTAGVAMDIMGTGRDMMATAIAENARINNPEMSADDAKKFGSIAASLLTGNHMDAMIYQAGGKPADFYRGVIDLAKSGKEINADSLRQVAIDSGMSVEQATQFSTGVVGDVNRGYNADGADATILNGREVGGINNAFSAAATVAADTVQTGMDVAGPSAQFALLLRPVMRWFEDLMDKMEPTLARLADKIVEWLGDFIESVTGWELDGKQEVHSLREPALAAAPAAPVPMAPVF